MAEVLPIEPQITVAELERLRLSLRRNLPSQGLGAHLHRRMGQSLEFREFRDYSFGDDVRKVDWLASTRRGRPEDLVVRSFEAEEQRTLLVLLDCRPAMALPEGAEKLRVGLWILQCLVHIALAEGDRVFVGTVFDHPDQPPMPITGRAGLARLRRRAAQLLGRELGEDAWSAVPQATTAAAQAVLRPAAAVALISDMLFDDPQGQLARFSRKAQQSYRSLHIIEIDSWPMERAMLAAGPFKLAAMEGTSTDTDLRETDTNILKETDKNITRHQLALRQALAGPALVWPEPPFRYPICTALPPDRFISWFRQKLPAAPFLGGLLSRVSA